jgi:hypothetical protein
MFGDLGMAMGHCALGHIVIDRFVTGRFVRVCESGSQPLELSRGGCGQGQEAKKNNNHKLMFLGYPVI